jgi:hypothetical protein
MEENLVEFFSSLTFSADAEADLLSSISQSGHTDNPVDENEETLHQDKDVSDDREQLVGTDYHERRKNISDKAILNSTQLAACSVKICEMREISDEGEQLDESLGQTPKRFKNQGIGSGVLVKKTDKKIFIITCRHVVAPYLNNPEVLRIEFYDSTDTHSNPWITYENVQLHLSYDTKDELDLGVKVGTIADISIIEVPCGDTSCHHNAELSQEPPVGLQYFVFWISLWQ